MNRLVWVGLACLLLSATGLAQSGGYVVTDLKGVPELAVKPEDSAVGLELLKKVQTGTITLDDKEKLTLTSLRDGSRFILTGPVKGALSAKGFQKLSGTGGVEKRAGRQTGDEAAQLRTVSSTMGAGAVRGGGPLLVSRGALLEPELAWIATATHPACQITIHKNGEVIKEWTQIEGVLIPEVHSNPPTIVDITDLGLAREEAYFINFMPLRAQDGELVPDPQSDAKVLDKSFKLIGNTQSVLAYEKEAREAYLKDPNDLSPLTSYLAYLLNNKLYCAALKLLYEPEFKEQSAMKTDLLRELASK